MAGLLAAGFRWATQPCRTARPSRCFQVGLQRTEPIVKERLRLWILNCPIRESLPVDGQSQIRLAIGTRNQPPKNNRTPSVGPQIATGRPDSQHEPVAEREAHEPGFKLRAKPSAGYARPQRAEP
jgi:5-methylcytosine-specific restriction endonuclease McrA